MPWQPNQEADHHNFSYMYSGLPKQHLYQISPTASVVLEELSFKKFLFFLNLTLPWQSNEMVADHKTHNWVDNHQMIITAKYGSHHFSGYGENAI